MMKCEFFTILLQKKLEAVILWLRKNGKRRRIVHPDS